MALTVWWKGGKSNQDLISYFYTIKSVQQRTVHIVSLPVILDYSGKA